MECAGNGRAFLHPAVVGEQWGLGAVATACWTGVPLVNLLEEARLRCGCGR
jgi:DMSO/TMAO reductase YedYZ molybdopterin-dependent catalytic subunit